MQIFCGYNKIQDLLKWLSSIVISHHYKHIDSSLQESVMVKSQATPEHYCCWWINLTLVASERRLLTHFCWNLNIFSPKKVNFFSVKFLFQRLSIVSCIIYFWIFTCVDTVSPGLVMISGRLLLSPLTAGWWHWSQCTSDTQTPGESRSWLVWESFLSLSSTLHLGTHTHMKKLKLFLKLSGFNLSRLLTTERDSADMRADEMLNVGFIRTVITVIFMLSTLNTLSSTLSMMIVEDLWDQDHAQVNPSFSLVDTN